jgi:glycosyltransferase involved in cell wall biosynthesis
MKIAILTSAHSAFDDRIFHKQARSLARAGYEVTIVAPHERDEEVEGVRVLSVPRSRTRLKRMLLTPPQILLRGLRVRAAIYHFHDPELIPVGLFLRALGKKVIYDVHEFNADTVLTKHWIPTALRQPVSKGIQWLDHFAAGKMDGVVTVNEDMAELFRSRLRSPRPVVAIHNYPELPQVAVDDEHVGRETAAIYVGSLSKERGLEVLIEAGDQLKRRYPEARVQILGSLDLTGVREEYASVDRWHVNGVEYLGVVDHREVPKWLRRAQVGLVPLFPTPNHVKAKPVKLFEYMLAGLPVVASDFGFIGQIVRETGCGLLVAPGDPAALTAAVESLLRDPAKTAEMGQKGRRAVLEKYNWGSEEKKLLALYAQLLGRA